MTEQQAEHGRTSWGRPALVVARYKRRGGTVYLIVDRFPTEWSHGEPCHEDTSDVVFTGTRRQARQFLRDRPIHAQPFVRQLNGCVVCGVPAPWNGAEHIHPECEGDDAA